MIPQLDHGMYLPNVYPFNVSELVQQHHYPALDVDEGGDYDNHIACCDAGRHWPGQKCWRKERNKSKRRRQLCKGKWRRDKERKFTFWWSCGFRKQDPTTATTAATTNTTAETELIIDTHHNLLEYKWMRIRDGIGAVFGFSNNGRTCIPSKIPCGNDGGR
jgi:hypothetical protein